MADPRVLVGSPIKQDPEILKEFLWSLGNLDFANIAVDFMFVDDNDQPASVDLLTAFQREGCTKIIEPGRITTQYECDEVTHHWNQASIWHVAEMKDRIIKRAKDDGYDYLFLIDSDLVLHPSTLHQLINSGKDIISEVFWTKWQPDQEPLPQVWLWDSYYMYRMSRGEQLTQQEAQRRAREFLDMMRRPGVYEVGGLGACTVLSKEAIHRGVSFAEVYNLSFWGEDRHFCIRAAALGLRLHVDTHYPAYHIYRKSDLAGVEECKRRFGAESVKDASSSAALPVDENELLDVATYGIEAFWSFDFRAMAGMEASVVFHPTYWEELARDLDKRLQDQVDRRLITRCRVEKATLQELDVVHGDALVAIKARLDGVESDRYFDQNVGVFVLLNRVAGAWFIRKVQFGTRQDAAEGFKDRIAKYDGNKITLAMLVRNEADRHLRRVLSHAAKYVDAAVILDDASDDDTAEICRETLAKIPHTIVSNPVPSFANEVVLRKQLWNLAASTNPDWILCLDADEMLEERAVHGLHRVVDQPFSDYFLMRLYDFWDDEHYRDDQYWKAHNTGRIFLTRYQPGFSYTWLETAQHCGRFPNNLMSLPGEVSDLRVKHLGWARPEDRLAKYQRYMELDPGARYGVKGQYESILDPAPKLVKWCE